MSSNRPGQHGGVCKLGHFTSVFTDCYKSVNRTVQKTEECFPGGHRASLHITPIDEDVQKMTDDANKIAKRHKRIVSLVQQYLKHGPIAMTKEYIYEGTESWRKRTSRNNEQMQLGSQMVFAGRAFGELTLYGNVMLDVGMAQQDIGHEELKFVTMTALSLLIPMKNFISTDLQNISKQKQMLMHRRLELDRAIGRASRSSKSGYDHSDSVPDPQNKARVQNAQTAFDHQQCVTKQACYTVEKEKKRMIVAFLRFIECQLVYMRRCAAISEAVKANLIKKLKMESLSDVQWPDSNFPYIKILDDEPPVVCPKPVYAKIPPKPAGDATVLGGIFPMKKKERENHHSTSESTQSIGTKRRKDTFELDHARNDSPEDALEPDAQFDIAGNKSGKARKDKDNKRNDSPDDAVGSPTAPQKLNTSKSAKSVKFEDCFRIPGFGLGKKQHKSETEIETNDENAATGQGMKPEESKKPSQSSTASNKDQQPPPNNTSVNKGSMTDANIEEVKNTDSNAGSEEASENVVRRTLTGSINNIKKTLGSLRSSFKKSNPDTANNSEAALVGAEEPVDIHEEELNNQAQDETFLDSKENEEEHLPTVNSDPESAENKRENIQEEKPQVKLSDAADNKENLTNIPVKGGRLSDASQAPGSEPVKEENKPVEENVVPEEKDEKEEKGKKHSKHKHEKTKHKKHKSHKNKSKEKSSDEKHENAETLNEGVEARKSNDSSSKEKPQAEKVSVEEVVNGVSLGKAEVELKDMADEQPSKKKVSKSIVEVVIHSQRPSTVVISQPLPDVPKDA